MSSNYIGGVAEDGSRERSHMDFLYPQGIKFHNEDELTAHDVKFSVDNFASQSEIESTNPGRRTWQATTITPKSSATNSVTVPETELPFGTFLWTRIIPKNYYEELGMEEFAKNPSSRTYKFVELVSWTSKMEANTEHWRFKPDFMYVEVSGARNDRINMLRTGEVDHSPWHNCEEWLNCATLKALPVKWATRCCGQSAPEPGRQRPRRYPCPQGHVYAINRESLVATLRAGSAGGRWYMHPGCYGWDPSWKSIPMIRNWQCSCWKKRATRCPLNEIIFYVTPAMVEQAQLLGLLAESRCRSGCSDN